MSKIRQRRTADQIQRIISDLCHRQVRDPRLQGLTFTKVMIDRELQHANIYVNALGDESRHQDTLSALENATGFFRRELSVRMRIRSVPQLHFRWDPTLAHADEVDRLLDSLDIPPAEDMSPETKNNINVHDENH